MSFVNKSQSSLKMPNTRKNKCSKMAECCHVTICNWGNYEFICPGENCEKRYDNCGEVSCLPSRKEKVFTCHHKINGIGWVDTYKCEGTRKDCEDQNTECECGWKGKEEKIEAGVNTKAIKANISNLHIRTINKSKSSNNTGIHIKKNIAIGGGLSIN